MEIEDHPYMKIVTKPEAVRGKKIWENGGLLIILYML